MVKPHLRAYAEGWDNGSEDILYPPHRPHEEFEADPENSWVPRTKEEHDAVSSFEGCKAMCQAEQHCFQFAFRPNTTSNGQPRREFAGQCGLRMAITLGEEAEEKMMESDEGDSQVPRGKVQSGWDLERIELWTRKHRCDEGATFLTEWGDDGNMEPPRSD